MSRIPLVALTLLFLAPPGISADLLTGGPEAIQAEIREHRGQPVLVNFWATWCKPCVHELPMLVKLQKEYEEKGVAFYAVSFDTFVFDEEESRTRISEMLEEHGVTWSQALVTEGIHAASEAFGIGGVLPTTLFLDAEGDEAHRISGMLTEDATRAALDRLVD